jgi:hypothetical protein
MQKDPIQQRQEAKMMDMFYDLSKEFVVATSNNTQDREFSSYQDQQEALRSLVPPREAPVKTAGMDQQQFFAQDVDTDEFGPTLKDLHPGDFLEIRRYNLLISYSHH